MKVLPLNDHFRSLSGDYLFAGIAERVRRCRAEHPEAPLYRHDIGDVTLPLVPTVVSAMQTAAEEMGRADGFRGYPPYGGHGFLKEAFARYYRRRGVTLDTSEIFVSDGAKNDLGNLSELFGDVTVLLPNPSYPVARDTSLMCGRRILSLPATKENGFLPLPTMRPEAPYLIYLCSPSNPTGTVYGREGLAAWVRFAEESGSVILFDGAYEAYAGTDMSHSIYEIEGAKNVAVELTSLSKSAGFTGIRVSCTVVPSALTVGGVSLRDRWARRQSTKFNGISYISERGAEAALSEKGIAEWSAQVRTYLDNAARLSHVLSAAGVFFTGGSSPYVFMECPRRMGSWEFFELLLKETGIVGTPGAGFGTGGEGYLRLSAFADCQRSAPLLGAFLSRIL